MERKDIILTITGSDSSGFAGIQADLLCMNELNAPCATVITSITAQNTLGIQDFFDIPTSVVQGQIDAIQDDANIKIVKIGMLRNKSVVDSVSAMIVYIKPLYVVYDPIAVSARGERIIDDDILNYIADKLVPLCNVVVKKAHNSHGANNIYSSSLCAFLYKGFSLAEAQVQAEAFTRKKEIRNTLEFTRVNILYQTFIKLLEANISTERDLSFYSKEMNVSTRYLSQICHHMGDNTPKQIIDERLNKHLRQLLLSSEDTIQQIALSSGFSSQAHFTRFFKSKNGITPSQFRKSNNSR